MYKISIYGNILVWPSHNWIRLLSLHSLSKINIYTWILCLFTILMIGYEIKAIFSMLYHLLYLGNISVSHALMTISIIFLNSADQVVSYMWEW